MHTIGELIMTDHSFRSLSERLKKRPQCVELRDETAPVSWLQSLDGAVIVRERLRGACVGGACRRRGAGCRQKRRRRSGLLKERRQGRTQRLLHHDPVATGRDHPLELGLLARFRAQLKRRDV